MHEISLRFADRFGPQLISHLVELSAESVDMGCERQNLVSSKEVDALGCANASDQDYREVVP
jgi:hypothetical protein